MRTVPAKLANKSYDLAVTFKSSMEIAQHVADPLMIARETVVESMMLERGIPYAPRWEFTIENVTQTLVIAMKHTEGGLSQSEVEEAVFETGFIHAKAIAAEYISAIVGPSSEEPIKGGGEGKE